MLLKACMNTKTIQQLGMFNSRSVKRCHPFFSLGCLMTLSMGHLLAAPENQVLDAISAKKLLDRAKASGSQVLIIDARAEAEFQHSHIPGALNISNRNVAVAADILMKKNIDKDVTLLVYSGTGIRSGRMIEALVGAYPHVFGLDKGLRAWEQEGFPIKKAGP